MTRVHAVPNGTQPAVGQCQWEHASHGVLLDCPDAQLPGELLCWEHYILRVQASPDPDVVPPVEVRSFGPVPVATPEVTA